MADSQYADKTLTELRDLAKERDIDGRSAMNREELVAALDADGNAAADAPDAGGHTLLDSVQETEGARTEDAQSSPVDVPYPDGFPGPAPARSAPTDPNAKMSTVSEG
jgi:hypothetical protein